MDKKVTDCQAHQPNIDQMQNRVKDFKETNKVLQSLEKTLRHAMDMMNPPTEKEVKPELGKLNIVRNAEVVGVFDDNGEKSTKSEAFTKYMENSLVPSAERNDMNKFIQSDNQDGYRSMGANAAPDVTTNVVINLRHKYALTDCTFYVMTGMASHVKLAILDADTFTSSKSQNWVAVGTSGPLNNANNKLASRLLMTKKVTVNKTAKYLRVSFSNSVAIQAVGGIKCFL